MKVTGFFRAASSAVIAPSLREELVHRLGNAGGGWSAVAVGAGEHTGVALKAAGEQAAIDGALADCTKVDRSCRVIAIGPFAVDAK
jgi:adenylate cyclase